MLCMGAILFDEDRGNVQRGGGEIFPDSRRQAFGEAEAGLRTAGLGAEQKTAGFGQGA
jgi:hypothetical protein